MTVRDLLEFVSEHRTVKIKPNGRRVYYLGSSTEVPEGLMECEVTELAPGLDDEDNLVLGVWVTADKDWDLIVDSFGKADDVVSAVYDSAYYQLIVDRETQEQEAQKIIQKNREGRKDRWHSENGLKVPKYTDIQDVVREHLRPYEKTRDLMLIPDEMLTVEDGDDLFPDGVLER